MWADILKGKVNVRNLPRKVKKLIKSMNYHYVGHDITRRHTRHYFKLTEDSPYVLWVDTSGSPSRGENILTKIKADIRRTAQGRGRGSGALPDDFKASADIYEFADSIVKSENFQQFLNENVANIKQHFREVLLEEVDPKIRAEWGVEQWALLDKEAEDAAQEFMQKEIFDKVKSKYTPYKIEKKWGIPHDIRELVFNLMTDGMWRTIPEINREVNLKNVWDGYSASALSAYLKNATGKHTTRGGNLMFDRKKVTDVYVQPNGVRNKRRIFSYRLLTEKLHKAKLVSNVTTKISQRKEPVEEPDEQCRDRLKRIRRNVRADYAQVPDKENKDYILRRHSRVPHQFFGMPEEVACAALDLYDKLNYTDNWGDSGGTDRSHLTETKHDKYKDKKGKLWYISGYKHIYSYEPEMSTDPDEVDEGNELMIYIESAIVIDVPPTGGSEYYRVQAHVSITLNNTYEELGDALENAGEGEYGVEEGRADPIELIKKELKELKEAFV